MNWRALGGSAAAHAVVMIAMFVVYPSQPLVVPSTIQVNLINLPQGALASPSVPKVEPAQTKTELEAEKTPNRPRDKVVKLPKADADRPKTPAAKETAVETAPAGAPGLAAGLAVDAADFEFTYYLIALRNKIGQNWSAPAGLATGGKPVRAVVYFRIKRDGSLQDQKLEESSGISFFDQSALRAVLVSNPVPPLPLGYGESTLGVHFAFEYTGN